MYLVYISLPHATYGVICEDEFSKVIDAPPMAKWAVGRDIHQVVVWAKRAGADIKWVKLDV